MFEVINIFSYYIFSYYIFSYYISYLFSYYIEIILFPFRSKGKLVFIFFY